MFSYFYDYLEIFLINCFCTSELEHHRQHFIVTEVGVKSDGPATSYYCAVTSHVHHWGASEISANRLNARPCMKL